MKIVLRGGGKKIVLRQTGRRGPQGEPGEGVPTGGTTDQVLAKASNADFDTEWVDLPEVDTGVISVAAGTGIEVDDDDPANPEVSLNSATQASLSSADTALQPSDNVSELTNDAGYITASDIPAAPVTSVNGQTGAVVLDAGDVGADAAGSAAQALSDANDYTDSAVAGVDTGVMTVVAGNNVTVDNTDPANPVVSAADAPAAPVTSVNGRTGAVTGLAEQSDLTAHTSNTNNPHNVTKSQVGLGNVDNTSDADKPISTATQNALNLKLDASRLIQGVGFPNGVVTAPVGTIYVDTAVTNGASSWIKKSGTGNTGWAVLEGDTGWRDITSLYPNDMAVSNVNDYGFLIRRVGDTVHYNIKAQTVQTSWTSQSRPLPQGFGVSVISVPQSPAALNEALQTAGTGRGQIQIGTAIIFVSSTWSSAGIRFSYNSLALTSDNWPSSLPGTAV
jgi:hypothetical protein